MKLFQIDIIASMYSGSRRRHEKKAALLSVLRKVGNRTRGVISESRKKSSREANKKSTAMRKCFQITTNSMLIWSVFHIFSLTFRTRANVYLGNSFSIHYFTQRVVLCAGYSSSAEEKKKIGKQKEARETRENHLALRKCISVGFMDV